MTTTMMHSNFIPIGIKSRKMKVMHEIHCQTLDIPSSSHPFHNPCRVVFFISSDVQCGIELKNVFMVPRMLEFKYFEQSEVIEFLKNLLKAFNIAHSRDIEIFVREYLMIVIKHPGIVNGLLSGLEAIPRRSKRSSIQTGLKESQLLPMNILVEERSFNTTAFCENGHALPRIWKLQFFFGCEILISMHHRTNVSFRLLGLGLCRRNSFKGTGFIIWMCRRSENLQRFLHG